MSARPALIDLAKIAVVGALVALLTPLFFAHRAFHRWRSRRELPPAVTPIPSVGLDERSLADIIDGDEPVIVTGLVEALTLARSPDPRMVVDSSSWISAGPSITAPTASAYRSYTGQST